MAGRAEPFLEFPHGPLEKRSISRIAGVVLPMRKRFTIDRRRALDPYARLLITLSTKQECDPLRLWPHIPYRIHHTAVRQPGVLK